MRKHGLMMWCDVLRALLVGSIPLLGVLWHVTLGQIYAVALLGGTLSVFFDVSYQSYVPRLVGGAQLMDANGKLGTTNSFAGSARPLGRRRAGRADRRGARDRGGRGVLRRQRPCRCC